MNNPVKIWRNQKQVRSLLGKSGIIISYTRVYVPSAKFKNQSPYTVVMVKISNKNTVGQLVDDYVDNDLIGKKVKAIVRRVGDVEEGNVIFYGIKFAFLN